ncbi:MAG: hypothetical protein AAGM22_22155 [Acidobacteriota bacterium]
MKTRFLCLLLFSLTLVSPAQAAPQAGADDFQVFLYEAETPLPFSTLTQNDVHFNGTLSVSRDPLYGDLLPDGSGGFTYVANDEFWSLEMDSFVYKLTDASGESEALVALHAGRLAITEVHMDENFENDNAFQPNTPYTITLGVGSDLQWTEAAQLEGEYGAEFISFGEEAMMSSPDDQTGNGGGGTGNQGSGGATGTVGCLIPPPNQDGIVASTALMGVGGDPEALESTALLRVRVTDNNYIVLEAKEGAGYRTSSELKLPGDRVFFELEWALSTNDKHNILLRIDGRAVRLMDVDGLDLTDPVFHFGLSPPLNTTLTVPVHLAFDKIKVFSTEGQDLQPSILLALEDFESTDDVYDLVGTGVAVNAGGAISGQQGLEASALNPGYSVSPDAALTPRLTTSLRVDFSQYVTTYGELPTFYAFGDAPTALSTDTEMRLRIWGGQGNEPRLIGTFANATTQGVNWSLSHAMPLGPVTLQVQFQAATSAEHANGFLRVWKNDEVLFEFDDLDALGSEADWNHLGLYAAGPGTSGYLLMDEFLVSGR